MSFISKLFQYLDTGYQVDTVYTDIKSAFDRVSHKLLLMKLSKLGLSTSFVHWIGSYLSNRNLHVSYGSSFSLPFSNSSGVPQGSVLSPLLFLLFINDNRFILPSPNHLLYADDIKVFVPVMQEDDCSALQSLLNSLSSWCAWNFLELCPSKCSVISFCRRHSPLIHDYVHNNTVINRVSCVCDLGVMLDERLSFDSHL